MKPTTSFGNSGECRCTSLTARCWDTFVTRSGIYYWDVLVKNSPRLGAFRELFGNEELDYNHALKSHYVNGPRQDWWNDFVSAYASVHPWEDWAETWAHYMHMTDTTGNRRLLWIVTAPAANG